MESATPKQEQLLTAQQAREKADKSVLSQVLNAINAAAEGTQQTAGGHSTLEITEGQINLTASVKSSLTTLGFTVSTKTSEEKTKTVIGW
jgi:hypothetical protein